MLPRTLAPLLALLVTLTGCLSEPTGTLSEPTPEVPTDALPEVTLPGPLKILRLEYDLGYMAIQDSRGAPYPTMIRGSVHFPSQAQGPFPLILFMHGRHGTCKVGQSEFLGPVVCPSAPPAMDPVENYKGYDYLAAPLAAHGYVVVSINANNLNDLDATMGDLGAVGRAQLIARTLDEFASLNRTPGNAPIGTQLVGRVDMNRIGLMGHSRGGEGVTRFISFNEQRANGPRYPLSAVFALAPTDFARWKVTNVTHAVLLPFCDGDVSNLQGAWMYDDARYLAEARPSPKIQILAMGSNHNNYNTIWTGDDGGRYNADPHCGPTNPAKSEPGRRLSPEDQRRHGRTYMEAFFRHYVGGEPGFGPLFTGAAAPPPEACPPDWNGCADYLHVSYHAPAPARLVVEDTLDSATLERNDAGGASTLAGFTNQRVCNPPACPPQNANHGRAPQLVLTWKENATWTLAFPARSVEAFDVLSFRAVADYLAPENAGRGHVEVFVSLRDASGASSTVEAHKESAALFVAKGGTARRAVPNEVRIPLAAFAGVDLTRVAEVRLALPGQGSLLVTDVLFQDEPPTHA